MFPTTFPFVPFDELEEQLAGPHICAMLFDPSPESGRMPENAARGPSTADTFWVPRPVFLEPK